MSSKHESTLSWMIMLGLGCMVVGALLFFTGFTGGVMQLGRLSGPAAHAANMAVLGIVLAGGGLVLLAIGVFSGLLASKLQNSGQRKIDPQARVVARYALGKNGDMALSDWEWDYPGMRFFVRMTTSDRQTAEYECVRPVFEQCGEGMTGEAMFQGRWLGGFRPHIGGAPPPSPQIGQDPLRS